MSTAPAALTENLGSGTPLDEGSRSFFRAKLGRDFSDVRLHTDERAGRSAHALNALAYTLGRDIVFAPNRYAPDTAPGRRLLAHELAHVAQQGGSRAVIHRTPACPDRPAGEAARSRADGFLADTAVFTASLGRLDIVDFGVDRASLPPHNITGSQDWERAMSLMAGDPTIVVGVEGFTDCVGTDAENLSLREKRAQAVIDAMPAVVRKKVLVSGGFGTGSFPETNATPAGRARNRSVRVTFVSGKGTDACDLLPRAKTIDEYLFLIRCLETRLKLTKPTDTPAALSVLRQIYYGSASWTVKGGRSEVWDMVIADQPWSPGTDPTAALRPALFTALQESQTVKTGTGEETDIGHVLTGIDAMMNPAQYVQIGPLSHRIPNEEFATWAGDVGSAVAHWALDVFEGKATATNRAHLDLKFKDFAGDDDLIGDVDSFALRAGLGSGKAQLLQPIQLTGPLSEALLQYFRITTSAAGVAHGERFTRFVEAYGGTVASGKLTNRTALIARLRPSVDNFTHLFMLKEMKARGISAGAPGTTTLLSSAGTLRSTGVDEMTARFVDWLTKRL